MKKLLMLLVVISITFSAFTQAPQKMSYQCVVRNNTGGLVTNHAVGMKISILQGSPTGTVVFSETYTPAPQTNANGLVTVEIGSGSPITGTFTGINWATGPYYLKTETDPAGGTNYTISGTSQLLSVPYALHSKTAQTADYNNLTNLPTLNISNWNTAYSWGNHTGLYRTISWVPTWADVTGKPSFATIATSGSYNDLSNKPTITNSQWTTSGSNIYYNSGNVGIGTSSPATYIHAHGSPVASRGQLSLSSPAGQDIFLSFYEADIFKAYLWYSVADQDLRLQNFTAGDLNLNPYGGKVGVGTNTPGYTLDVAGNINFTGTLTQSGSPFAFSWANIGGKPTTVSGYGITDAVTITGDQTITGIKTFSNDILINGLTVGKGKGAISTNTAVGNQALNSTTTGYENTAIGYRALNSNTTGYWNAANGSQALRNNTTGSLNTAIGDEALKINSTGNYNTATGYAALYSNTTANDNTANGVQALYWNTTGGENTGIGKGALFSNTTGQSNTANGTYALYWNTTGNNNIATGYQALNNNTTASNNTANGYQALYSNTTESNITAIGYQALYSNTTGWSNTAVGSGALYANTDGANNVAIGTGALHWNTSGSDNNVIGWSAAAISSTGHANEVIGSSSFNGNTSGSGNISIGDQTFNYNTTGSNNVVIGWSAGSNNKTGNDNILIGSVAETGGPDLHDAIAIGEYTKVTASNTFLFGNSDIIGWGFGVNPGTAAIRVGHSTSNGNGATLTLTGVWTNASDISKKYDIENINYGLNEVMKLHPVTYKLKGTKNQDIGFIAQEVKKIVPEIIYGEEGQMTMSYGQLTSVLVKAVQEQQKQIEELKDLVKSLIANQTEMDNK